jgi:ankyrin repeat protein
MMIGNPEVVTLLVKQGARVNYAAELSRPSPLDLAILKGDVQMVQLLLAAGKTIDLVLIIELAFPLTL